MALSKDQQALLRLLAQREEGYEDIGALMGLSVEEVRARVQLALVELDEGIHADATFPLSQARREDPSRRPGAATAPAGRRSARVRPRATRPASGKWLRPPASPQRRRLLAISGGALALIAAALIAVTAIEGGESGGSTSASGSNAETASARQLTQAVLRPVGGSSGTGRALLGRLGNNVVLEVVAKGLAPSAPGESYAIWLYHSPKLVLRIGAVKVGQSGGLAARLPIPAELLAYVASGAFGQIYVSATPEAAYKAEVARAKAQNRLPAYIGATVLRGKITGPAVRVAKGSGG